MQLLKNIRTIFNESVLYWHYDSVQDEINDLHEEIDKLSVRLGELIKLKCQLEIEIHKQEQ